MLQNLTKESLLKIARDMAGNLIFTSAQVRDSSLLGHVFMPLLFGGIKKEDAEDVGMVYEYLRKAGPRSINGYPMFTSCHLVNKHDWKIILRKYKAITKAMESVK